VRYDFHFEAVFQQWQWLVRGLGMTLYISTVSMALALGLGLAIALCSLSRIGPLRVAAHVYVQVFRGIPLLVFVIWMYYGVSMVVGINFNPITAGILCFTLQYGSWLSEIYRSGIQAVGRGQWEAAASLGLSEPQAFVSVVLPQAIRIVLPGIANMFVGMIKDSSLVSVIGVFELMRQAQLAASLTFRPFEFYTVTAAVYILLTFLIARALLVVERRLHIPGT